MTASFFLTDTRFLESEYVKDELAPTLNNRQKPQVPLYKRDLHNLLLLSCLSGKFKRRKPVFLKNLYKVLRDCMRFYEIVWGLKY